MKFDEQVIKEKRVIEAAKKEYQGGNGKLALICKNLGDKMVDQGGRYDNFIKYDAFWGSSNEMEYLDENTPLSFIGYYFYGLSYSANLEIFYFENDKKIEVKYEGELVYKEINGDLECFVPKECWEKKIEEFYNLAKKIEDNNKKNDKEIKKQLFEKKKNNILDYIKQKWGV